MNDLIPTPADWEYGGKTYKVCRIDLHIMGLFSDWTMREAAIALEKLAPPHSSPAFYDGQMRIFNSKVAGKLFRWGSEDVNNAAWSIEGRKHLLWLKIMRGVEKGGAGIQREVLDPIADNDPKKWQELVDILYQQDYPDFFTQVIKPERDKQSQTSPEEVKSSP